MLENWEKWIAAGISLIPVRKNGKAPIKDDWSALPTYTAKEFEKTYKPGQNIGIRPGEFSQLKNGDYLITIDLDISSEDAADEAYAKLKELIPSFKCFVEVQSGNKLGLSRHYFGSTDKPLRSKKLWHHPEKIPIPGGKKKDKAQIDIIGTGKQHVAPGSTHPDGFKYELRNPEALETFLDEILDDHKAFAFIASSVFEKAAGRALEAPEKGKGKSDDLSDLVHNAPVDLTDDQIIHVLDDLPHDRYDDYQSWLEMAFAIEHQFRDDPDYGLELFHYASKKSDKYDADAVDSKWESIKDDKGRGSFTFRTLIMEANKIRKKKVVEEVYQDEDELEDVPRKKRVWAKQLYMDQDGGIKSVPANAVLIFKNDHRITDVIRFNQFLSNAVQFNDIPQITPSMIEQKCRDKINGMKWSDTNDRNMRMFLEARRKDGGWGMKIADRDLTASVDIAAQANPFHPVADYLEGLKWDGVKRLDWLFVDYLGAPDTPLNREIARLTLVGAIARIFKPGHKFDFVPILEGLQGKRKSTFVKILAKGWFGGLHPDFHDSKAMVESMMGRWILELPELAGFGRADVKTIKQFITTETDTVRLSYDRRAQDYPRQCIFIGTTNDEQYLADETGNRRYWPVPCHVKEIDTDKLLKEIDQFWAEALTVYDTMRADQPHGDLPLYIRDPASKKEVLALQSSRETESTSDGWLEIIKEWIDKKGSPEFDNLDDDQDFQLNQVSLMDIWTGAFGQPPHTYKDAIPKQLGAAMRKLKGWHYVGVRRDKSGKGRKMWQRIDPRTPIH